MPPRSEWLKRVKRGEKEAAYRTETLPPGGHKRPVKTYDSPVSGGGSSDDGERGSRGTTDHHPAQP